MAYLTFYADGAYTFKESGESVDYNTRASAVWIRTGNGWKSIHANWAPTADGTGIPQQSTIILAKKLSLSAEFFFTFYFYQKKQPWH